MYSSLDLISKLEMFLTMVLNSMLSRFIMYFRGIKLYWLSSTISIFYLQSHSGYGLNLSNWFDSLMWKLIFSSSSETLGMLLISSESMKKSFDSEIGYFFIKSSITPLN